MFFPYPHFPKGNISSPHRLIASSSFIATSLQRLPDLGSQNVNTDIVLAAHGDDDVGEAFGGFDEKFMHRFHEVAVVTDGLVKAASAFNDIAADDSDESFIRVGVNEHLDVQCVTEFWIGEDENAFHNQHFGRVDGNGFRPACTGHVRVSWHGDGLSLFQPVDVFNKQWEFYGRGVIEINLFLFLLRKVAVVAVIGILRQHTYVMFGKLIDDFLYHRSFSRAGSAGNTQY